MVLGQSMRVALGALTFDGRELWRRSITGYDQVAFLERHTGGGGSFLRFASLPSFAVTESLRLTGDEPTLSLHQSPSVRIFCPAALMVVWLVRHVRPPVLPAARVA